MPHVYLYVAAGKRYSYLQHKQDTGSMQTNSKLLGPSRKSAPIYFILIYFWRLCSEWRASPLAAEQTSSLLSCCAYAARCKWVTMVTGTSVSLSLWNFLWVPRKFVPVQIKNVNRAGIQNYIIIFIFVLIGGLYIQYVMWLSVHCSSMGIMMILCNIIFCCLPAYTVG